MEQTMKTPMHLWIVGGLSLVWNMFGCYDYVMTRYEGAEYFKKMMPGVDANAMQAYIDSFPIWAQAGWGFGVWGAIAGSILLLLRSRWAVVAFGLSLLGAVVSLGYQFMAPPGPAGMNEGAAGLVPFLIIGIAAALYYYAHRQRKNGVLR